MHRARQLAYLAFDRECSFACDPHAICIVMHELVLSCFHNFTLLLVVGLLVSELLLQFMSV